MWRHGGDWWRLWTESRAVCAACPVETPLGPRQGTRRLPASAPERRAARPASPRPQQSHPPRREPLLRLMRQALCRQSTRQAPASAPEWPPARPPPLRPLGSHPPWRCPLLRLMRRSVRRQSTRQVPASAPKWPPARPARRRRHRHHPTVPWAPTAASWQRRARPLERHLRERRLTVQRAPIAAVERRWPVSRSGSAFQQRRCHPATPEYRPLRAEPGPPAPRRHVSGPAPAARIGFRPEPARPAPRQHVSCAARVASMRPRFPAAAARYRRRTGRVAPPPRAPSAPPGRPTTCAGRRAT